MLLAAGAISLQCMGENDLEYIVATLVDYADKIRLKVRGTQPQAYLARLHEHLFEKLHYRTDPEKMGHAECDILSIVLKTRVGSPALLSLIYMITARRLGIDVNLISVENPLIVAVKCYEQPIM